MEKFALTLGSMIVTVPIVIFVLWLGMGLFGVIMKILMTGAPIAVIGGLILFGYQMLRG